MKKFDLYVTYICASNCVFCCVLDKIQWFKQSSISPHLSLEEIHEILSEKRAAGFCYVTLTGGEPTLHPGFPEIVRMCKKMNMRVSVNTNATMLSDKKYCDSVIPYIDEMVMSIHGHTAELHNRLTGTPRGFERFIKAMENIHASERIPYLITDTVLTTENIGYIQEICDFLIEFPRLQHILFSNVNIPPDKLEGLEYLVPTLDQVEKILPIIVDTVAKKANRVLRFYGVPFCVLKDYHAYSSDLFYESKLVLEQVKRVDGMEKRETEAVRPDKAKLKIEKCSACIYNTVCGGLFNSYFALYKDAHIKPIRK